MIEKRKDLFIGKMMAETIQDSIDKDTPLSGAKSGAALYKEWIVAFEDNYTLHICVISSSRHGPAIEIILQKDGEEVNVTEGRRTIEGEWSIEHNDIKFIANLIAKSPSDIKIA